MSTSTSSANDDDDGATSITYNVIAFAIFCMVSYCFFLPCNHIIPLDRRSASILGATLCYSTRSFLFPHNKMDLLDAIDFDVLVLLSGIMAINFIMVHQTEKKRVIRYVQNEIQMNPLQGFWLVSLSAFFVSPFLTNDGVCLLFVEPILNAFESLPNVPTRAPSVSSSAHLTLLKSDAIYFLLALACSSNIGSAMTYTGNPQNMIVAGDSLSVMSPLRFLGYMLLPSIFSFVITTLWIQRIWLRHHMDIYFSLPSTPSSNKCLNCREGVGGANMIEPGDGTKGTGGVHRRKQECLLSPHRIDAPVLSPVPIADGRVPSNHHALAKKVVKVLMVPFPYAMLLLMGIMVALIFVDLISISSLVCLTACVMVVTLVLGNHYRGSNIWGTMSVHRPSQHGSHSTFSTSAEIDVPFEDDPQINIESMNQFFEELFDSIDYNLLLIFLGLFVVVENLDSTGIPKRIWQRIVGDTPFDTVASVSAISIFVLIASQFLGNVAVCQLIKPNVEVLDDNAKRYAWAVIAYVATVCGNLTVPGSAANIIVAEKAARIDASSAITFYNHFAVCFFITLFCCCMGAVLITGIAICDNGMMDVW
jgi:Na+/H+ antiporter NhaD/arsenite permease-like protein